MKKLCAATLMLFITLLLFSPLCQKTLPASAAPVFKLGSEVFFDRYTHLIDGKNVGLITNQSGVNSQGVSTIDLLRADNNTTLAALYAPEHGLDGLATAGEYVQSYTHPQLGITVNSLYGATRMPTEAMLKNIDILLYDIQDIGARTYTYISTLNYCMIAAQNYHKPIVVLDRPNPLGGVIVEGPVLEDQYQSFVGIDNLPEAHGMTAGELALFFNRKIGADLTVIPMEGYNRTMVYADTGLKWIPTSPNIPDIASVFGYMATGIGEGTGVFQADQFKWIGGRGLDSVKYADELNRAGLPGITFIPEDRGSSGGARLQITDYHTFNPARTGIYALTTAMLQGSFQIPKSGDTIVMFDKVMGTNKIGQYLEARLTPQQIEANYAPALQTFKEERKKYLLPDYDGGAVSNPVSNPVSDPAPNPASNPVSNPVYKGDMTTPLYDSFISVLVNGVPVEFDIWPFIDENGRVMIPLRGVAESLGAEVNWNAEQLTVTIIKDNTTIIYPLGSRTVLVNGAPAEMDTISIITNTGRVMIPARYTGEYLGAEVTWDPDTKTVSIIKN